MTTTAAGVASTTSAALADPMSATKQAAAQSAAMAAAVADEKFKEDLSSGKYNNEDYEDVLAAAAALANSVTPPPPKKKSSGKSQPIATQTKPIELPEHLVPKQGAGAKPTSYDFITGPNGQKVAVPILGEELQVDVPSLHLSSALEKLDGLEVTNNNTNNVTSNSNSSSNSVGGSAKSEASSTPTAQLDVDENRKGLSPAAVAAAGTTTGGFMPAGVGLNAEGNKILDLVEKILGKDSVPSDIDGEENKEALMASGGPGSRAGESETGDLGALVPGKLKDSGKRGPASEDNTKIGTKTGNGVKPFEPVPIGTKTGNGRWLASDGLLRAGAELPEGLPIALLFMVVGLGSLVVVYSLSRRRLRSQPQIPGTEGIPVAPAAPSHSRRREPKPTMTAAWGVRGAGLISLKRHFETQRKRLGRPFDSELYPVDELGDFYVEESTVTHTGLTGDLHVEVASGLISGLIDPDTIHLPVTRPNSRYVVWDSSGQRWIVVKTDGEGKISMALAEVRPGTVVRGAVLGGRYAHGRYELLSTGKWVSTERPEKLVLRLLKRPGSAGAA